jgi:hypothetical protein
LAAAWAFRAASISGLISSLTVIAASTAFTNYPARGNGSEASGILPGGDKAWRSRVSAAQSGRASPRATEPINRTWVVPWLDSDVDLLVTWSEGASLLDQAALMLEIEKLLGRKVDIASDGWVKPAIRESVCRDAIAL